MTQELINRIAHAIESHTIAVNWDFRDPIDTQGKNISEWIEELIDLNADYVADLEYEGRKFILQDFLEEANEHGEWTLEELIDEFADIYPEIDYNLKELLKGEYMTGAIELLSDFDCINSFHFEFPHGYQWSKKGYPESYAADVFRVLRINPKAWAKKFGVEDLRPWPNIEYGPESALVDLDNWTQEEVNRSCAACLLTIPVKFDLWEMYQMEVNGVNWDETFGLKVKLDKGCHLGYFSSWHGGGSMLGAVLLQEMEIELNKEDDWGAMWRLAPENGYTIKDVYGSDDTMYNECELVKVEPVNEPVC